MNKAPITIMKAKKSGWLDYRHGLARGCSHFGLFFATLTIGQHDDGHRWLCKCGQLFVAVTNKDGFRVMEKAK